MRNTGLRMFFCLQFILLNTFLFSQNNKLSEYEDHYFNKTPMTPNASKINSFGDLGVENSKGIPDITIPIYTLNIDGFSLPINVMYDASGVKVDEISSSVGLKWSLNAGGGIFRTIKNKPDESGWTTENNSSIETDWYYNNSLDSPSIQNHLSSYDYDHSPDNFNYSIGGYSGSFIFKRKDINTILKDRNDNLKITPLTTNNILDSFIALDVKGNTYELGNNYLSKEINSTTVISGVNTNVNNDNEDYFSGWLINKITTKNNKHINFEYIEYNMNYTFLDKSHKIVRYGKTSQNSTSSCGVKATGTYETSNYVFDVQKTSVINLPKQKLISKISTEDIEINFLYSDFQSNAIWSKQLDKIEIIDKLSYNKITFILAYGTFVGSERLKLLSIKKSTNGVDHAPYTFSYNEVTSLPNYDSFSKDFFGYNNGENNTSLIPFTDVAYANIHFPYKERLANRKPNVNFAKVGTINEINYPTGGKTRFEYELNLENSDSIYGELEYEKGGFDLIVDNNNLNYLFSNGKRIYSQNFVIPEGIMEFNNYSSNGSVVSNIILNTSNNLSGCDNYSNPSIDCAKYYIFKDNQLIDGPKLCGYYGASNLDPGTYTLKLEVEEEDFLFNDILIKISFKWYSYLFNENGENVKSPKYSGGLRIKTIKDFDSDDVLTSEKRFDYEGLVGQSRQFNNFTTYKNNGEFVFSSEYIGHPDLFKSGYYYSKITENRRKINNNTLINPVLFDEGFNTIYTYTQDFSNYAYASKLSGVFIYNSDEFLLKKTLYDYSSNYVNYSYNILGKLDNCYMDGINMKTGYNWPQNMVFTEFKSELRNEVNTDYFIDNSSNLNNTSVINSTQYNDDNLVVISTSQLSLIEDNNLNYYNPENYISTVNSTSVIKNYKYPKDFSSYMIYDNLINKNLLALPVEVEVIKNNRKVEADFFVYDINGNVEEKFKFNKDVNSNLYHDFIPSNYELFLSSVNINGIPIEVNKANGIHVVYIWGYNQKNPIAKIENATYESIQSYVPVLQVLSDADVDHCRDYNCTEQQLRDALSNLRVNLPEALVSTYTYDPLIGMTSMTDSRGLTIYYEYDALNRLEYVKDEDGNILKKSEYNYAIDY